MKDKYELLRESLHELQREASAKGGNNPRSQMILDLLADYETLQAENERLRCDARRYRWIRDGGWLLIGEDRGNGPEWPPADTVDALVDRAIAERLSSFRCTWPGTEEDAMTHFCQQCGTPTDTGFACPKGCHQHGNPVPASWEEQPSPHSCKNCLGIDPDSCMMNQKRVVAHEG